MNPKTQYHIGTILKALGDLGQHLMGADPETIAPAPSITGEPTTDKPKAGRPRKPAQSVIDKGPVCRVCGFERGNHFTDGLHCPSNNSDKGIPLDTVFTPIPSEPVVAASAFSASVAVQAPTAAIATEDDFGAAPEPVTHKDTFASYEKARAFIDPFVKEHPGEVTKIIAGMLPEGKTGLRAMIEFPEKHPEFIKQILALK